MYRIKKLLQKLFTPVTIMLIPHTSRKTFRLKMPSIGIFASVIMCVIGIVYIFSVAVDTIRYREMEKTLSYYEEQFLDLKSTIDALKVAERDFRRLFSLGSKEAVLENLNLSDSGAIEMELLKRQIKKTIDTVGEIKDYLSQQRDLYRATPMGWPVTGWISSGFGKRVHPIRGNKDFHTGIDISTQPGKPVRVTADGIVSFSGWSGANGNLIAVEHGFGYTTFYAHNKKNLVKVGQIVKRGDIIAYVGSTGSSTGPHVHYEIWKEGKIVNPRPFLKGGKW